MSNPDTKNEIGNFDSSLGELEKLLERIETDELSLEDALTNYEIGINLIRTAQKILSQAEQKVQLLADRQADPVSSILSEDN